MGVIQNILQKVGIVPAKQGSPRPPVAPLHFQRIRQDAISRAYAVEQAERPFYPYRVEMQRMFMKTKEDAHIIACVNRRKDLTILRKWEFKNANGEIDDKLTAIFCDTINGKTQLKTWFINYLSYCLDALYFGYSLIYLGDVIDGDFPSIQVVKRENVSPDRFVISQFPMNPSGVKFLEEEEYKGYYIYVSTPNDLGTSPCGYGIYYDISFLEILLRNLQGFNGDYVELFAQPLRVGKTDKTNETERAEFEGIVRDMGSSAYAVLDTIGESIEIIGGSSTGTGYMSYDNFEKRLQDLVSQVVLGHSDAIKSIPGKLGNSGEKSPAESAMDDKATRDAAFILPLINNNLFTALRTLGFTIPDGSMACMLNDKEDQEQTHYIADLAVKMKNANLQMDGKYFTEQTGIPVTEAAAIVPQKNITDKIQNKLNRIYG